MAQKRPSKITFCSYKLPLVDEVGEFKPKHYQEAKSVCQILNDHITGRQGSLDNEFWFLNTRIDGNTHIITCSSNKDYPANDPAILDKIAAYLDKQTTNEPGSAQGRGQSKVYASEINPERKEQIHLVPMADKNKACDFAAEVQAQLGAEGRAEPVTHNGKEWVRVTSIVRTKEELEMVVNKLKAAQ